VGGRGKREKQQSTLHATGVCGDEGKQTMIELEERRSTNG
jgi:hypothetical protein